MKRTSVDTSKVTPMMRQYLDIKSKNEDIILFFRLGDFYEMFFEDALTVSRECELTLTGKSAGLDEKIPMCGVPHHSADIYTSKLVEKGYKIGICEQLEDPRDVKGIVKRDVVKIISKGTITNENSLLGYESNYIASVMDYKTHYVIAYSDITTGELSVLKVEHKITDLLSELVNLNIKEIIVETGLDSKITTLAKELNEIVVSYSDDKNTEEIYENLYNHIEDSTLRFTIQHLLAYFKLTQKVDLMHMQKAVVKKVKDALRMDIHTKRNLELTETIRNKSRANSLIDLLDKTKTAMGSRKLKQMINAPLIKKEEIIARYDIVDKLLVEFILKDELEIALNQVYDLERLSGRIAFGNANARDLLQLKKSIKALPDIKRILKDINYYDTVDTLDNLYKLLEESIYENPPIGLKEGYLIKNGYNSEIDELKKLRKGGKDFIAAFEAEEKVKTGIKNLKVGYNRVFGYYIEVSKGQIDLVKDEYGYERRQTLSNCERYISPILKEKESIILNAEEKIVDLEYFLFTKIRDSLKEFIPILQNNAKIISEIDVLQSFATVTEKNKYVRPTLNDDNNLKIIDSRHPVVEKVISTSFVENDIIMDNDTNILLITGPNMAGKSTYMRQLAITVIMAQIGCFIPAKSGDLKVFDAIYTRIGASDDLVSGESTFMVEMNEANNAIRSASKNSLILFDELGRGTATFDGMSLAQSIIEYISNKIKCKTLFSTHYHELTDLENELPDLKNIHVSAIEENGKVTFLHKIKEGSVDKSYGIHVANLAGLPKDIIKRADQILRVYESVEQKRDLVIQTSLPLDEIEEDESKLEEFVQSLDPNNMSPMEALNAIYEIKKIEKERIG